MWKKMTPLVLLALLIAGSNATCSCENNSVCFNITTAVLDFCDCHTTGFYGVGCAYSGETVRLEEGLALNGNNYAYSSIILDDDHFVLTGRTSAGILTAAAKTSSFTALVNRTAGIQWIAQETGTSTLFVRESVVDTAHQRIFTLTQSTGTFDGTSSLGSADALVFAYNATDGTKLWSKRYGSTSFDTMGRMHYASALGSVVVGVNAGGAVVDTTLAADDATFVALLALNDTDGTIVWAASDPSTTYGQKAGDITSNDQYVFLAIDVSEAHNEAPSMTRLCAFALNTGALLWSKDLVSVGYPPNHYGSISPYFMTFSSASQALVVGGVFFGNITATMGIDLFYDVLEFAPSTKSYVMRLSATTGDIEWVATVQTGNAQSTEAVGVDVDAVGNVLLAVRTSEPIGTAPSASVDGADQTHLFVYSSEGTLRSQAVIAASEDLFNEAVSVSPTTGLAVLTGSLVGDGVFSQAVPESTKRQALLTFANSENACASSPCQNSGTCTNGFVDFVCACPETATGTLCETLFDPCLSRPCQNNANCTATQDHLSFTCDCVLGFRDTLCETVDLCASNPCQNGGVCYEDLVSSVHRCNCTQVEAFGEVCQNIGQAQQFDTSPPNIDVGVSGDGVYVYTSSIAETGCSLIKLTAANLTLMWEDIHTDTTELCRDPTTDDAASLVCYVANYNGALTQGSKDVATLCYNANTAGATFLWMSLVGTTGSDSAEALFIEPTRHLVVSAGMVPRNKVVDGGAAVNHDTSYVVAYNATGHQMWLTQQRPGVETMMALLAHTTDRFFILHQGVESSTVWLYVMDMETGAQLGLTWFTPVNGDDYFEHFTLFYHDNAVFLGGFGDGDYTQTLTTYSNGLQRTIVRFDVDSDHHNATIAWSALYGSEDKDDFGFKLDGALDGTIMLVGVTKLDLDGITDASPSVNRAVVEGVDPTTGASRFTRQITQLLHGQSVTTTGLDLAFDNTHSAIFVVGGTSNNGYFDASRTDLAGNNYIARIDDDNDSCATSPCLNGGTCIDSIFSYICLCSVSFTGTTCETRSNQCDSSPCQNEGICVDGLGSFSCSCTALTTGTLCEATFSWCDSSPCQNTATCVDGTAGYTCTCAAGTAGDHCESNVDECASSPCLMNSTCVDSVNGFSCACVPGYTGTLCGTDVDECASSPCRNGGTCINLFNGFSCACVNNTSGAQCEVDCRGGLSVGGKADDYATWQDRIDGFAGCTSIVGDLVISGNITDSAGLASITTVHGALHVDTTSTLDSLDALANLVTVNGDVFIVDNADLTTSSGLVSFTTTTASQVTFSGNAKLVSCEGLAKLSGVTLAGALTVANNALMTSLNGIDALTGAHTVVLTGLPLVTSVMPVGSIAISTTLTVDNMDGLVALTGLLMSGTTEQLETLTLTNNDALVSLVGLEALTGVHGDLTVSGNSVLVTMTPASALDQLVFVDGTWTIANNAAMTSLSCPLAALVRVGTLVISDNAMLTYMSGFSSLTQATSITLSSMALLTNVTGAFASLVHADTLQLNTLAGIVDLTLQTFLGSTTAQVDVLTLDNMDSLTDVFLNDVLVINGTLNVANCDGIQTLAGLASLTTVYGNLTFASCSALTEITGLQQLTLVTGYVVLTGNGELCAGRFVSWDTVAQQGAIIEGSPTLDSVKCKLAELLSTPTNTTETVQTNAQLLKEVTESNKWLGADSKTVAAKLILDKVEEVIVYLKKNPQSASGNVTNNTLSSLDAMLDASAVSELKVQEKGRSTRVARLTDDFVDLLLDLNNCGTSVDLVGTYLSMKVIQVNDAYDIDGDYTTDSNNGVQLPSGFAMEAQSLGHLNMSESCFEVSFIEYEVNPFDSNYDNQSTTIDSNVVSLSVGRSLDINGLSNDTSVLITLRHVVLVEGERTCVYWDDTNEVWDSDGCEVVSSDAYHTVCRCNHLTNFALLAGADVYASLSSTNAQVLEVLSWVGAVLSILGCVYIIFVYAWIKALRTRPQRNILNLAVALLMLNLVFVIGSDRVDPRGGCRVVAALLYYFLLAMFLWTACIARDMTFFLVNLVGEPTPFSRYLAFAWGLPAVVTAVLVSVDGGTDWTTLGFGSAASSCFVSTRGGLIGAVMCPLALVMLHNVYAMVGVTRSLYKNAQSVGKTSSAARKNKQSLMLYCGLFVAMGLAWVFAYVAIVGGTVFWYLFVICNSTQGLLLCIFFVLRGRAWEETKKKAGKVDMFKSGATNTTSGGGGGKTTKRSTDTTSSSGVTRGSTTLQSNASSGAGMLETRPVSGDWEMVGGSEGVSTVVMSSMGDSEAPAILSDAWPSGRESDDTKMGPDEGQFAFDEASGDPVARLKTKPQQVAVHASTTDEQSAFRESVVRVGKAYTNPLGVARGDDATVVDMSTRQSVATVMIEGNTQSESGSVMDSTSDDDEVEVAGNQGARSGDYIALTVTAAPDDGMDDDLHPPRRESGDSYDPHDFSDSSLLLQRSSQNIGGDPEVAL